MTLLQEAAREVSTGNEPVNDSSTCSRNVQSGGTRARGTPRRVEGKPPAVSFSPAEGVQDPAARDAVGPSDVQGCSSAKVKTRASPDGGAKAVRSTKDKKRRPIRDSGGGADKTSVPQRQKSPEREADGLKKNTKAGVKGVKESARGEDKGQGEQRIGDHGKSSSGEGGCSLAASVVEEENAQERDNERDDNEINKKGKPKLSAERRDHLYAMSTTERCRYDVIFMQVICSVCCLLGEKTPLPNPLARASHLVQCCFRVASNASFGTLRSMPRKSSPYSGPILDGRSSPQLAAN